MSRTFDFVRAPYQAHSRLTEADLSAWEAARGVRLPEDYRRFLLRTNGEYLRPYGFPMTLPGDEQFEEEQPLKRLFDWTEVLEQTQEDKPAHLRNTPPGWLAIGTTEEELFVMLSLEAQSYGAVAIWISDFYRPWGEPPNDRIHALAQSFEAFLDMLTIADGLYHSYWPGHGRAGRQAERLTLP